MHQPPPPEGLADRTIRELRTFFERQNHHPSEAHWHALEDIAETMENMADPNGCEPKVFLSAVDPGIGKTQTTTRFAAALTRDERYSDVGMLVCVGRIAEAVSLAESFVELGMPPACFAVLTSDLTANALGNPDPNAAQVLVTTQQRIERACDGKTFAEVAAFHYRRHGPRMVRVWDEAYLPGCAVTVGKDDLFLLVKPLRSISPGMANAVENLAVQIGNSNDGDAVDVPDLEADHGVSFWDVLDSLGARSGRLNDDQQRAALALRNLIGRRARVRQDSMSGNAALTYRDTLPADLAPLIVLDASGRVRQTYRDIEDHRGTLVRLHEAVKDYAPLHVHVWRKSGSKSGFGRDGDTLIAGMAEVILTKPDEDWLVVAHHPGPKVKNVETALRRALPEEVAKRVRTICWGAHMATNEHAEVPNVILAGTLFYRASLYTALTHLGQDRDVAAGLASPEDVRMTERGEHRNLVLQALCRGRVRKSDGERCLAMNAYIIASNASGIPDDLPEVFPGCTVLDWRPGKRELTGRPAEALRFITEALRAAEWVSYRAVAAGIGMDWRGFRRWVLDHQDWVSTISASPFIEARGGRCARGVRMEVHEPASVVA